MRTKMVWLSLCALVASGAARAARLYARMGARRRLVVTVPVPATVVFGGETREVSPGTHTFGPGGALENFCVAYYPEAWDESRWPRDLALMKELGVDMVRIGEFNWGRFEPTEGTFDFAPCSDSTSASGSRSRRARSIFRAGPMATAT